MNAFFALTAIASVVSLFACLGRDSVPATRVHGAGMADQLSGNMLWHAAAIPGTSGTITDRQAPFA